LGVALVWLLIGALVLPAFRFSPTAVTLFRLAGYLVLAAVLIRFVILPLLRRVTDEQIARYIEEQEPGIEALLVSAVEQAEGHPDSVALAEQVVVQAVSHIRAADDGRRIEARRLRQAAGAAVTLAAAVLAALVIGPTTLKRAGRAFLPWQDAAAATPYAVLVTPGDVTVPKGGDVEIEARLRGFATEQVELLLREGGSPEWQRVPMVPGDSSGTWGFRMFDVTEPVEYVVEANGVRSRRYLVTVADLPAVQNLALELRYPAYTGLATERQDPGGDIAVPRGTSVKFMVASTRPTPAGRVITESGDTIPLKPGNEALLAGELRAARAGWYRIELQAPAGNFVEASLRYRIDVLDDVGPSVVMTKPGRDAQATAVEEVFAEARATDDYGVRKLELVYRVNGGEEQTASLYQGGGKRLSEVSAGHTFFLEELPLSPGDLITYFARATDNGPNGGRTASSDIYFLRIRPFGKDYRQAEQAGMPGQQGETPEGLSARQREIIAGTFKVQRDRSTSSEQQLREDLALLALTQGRLRERVEGLLEQLRRRNAVNVDSTFAIIQRELEAALPEMQAAENQLGQRKADDALPPEQRSLQHLQRAEEAFREVQVSFGNQGGGGGDSKSEAEDLADLFELETDKLQNQYETLERGEERERQRELDETLERLRQLAARQQQETERMQRQAGGQSGGQAGSQGGQSGASQRQLAQEAEELARQLERLTRDRANPEAAEAARRLQEAANAMRRAATGQSNSETESRSAADRLREASRSLEESRRAGMSRSIREASQRAQQLAERQRDIAQDVGRATQGAGRPDMETQRRLSERKDSLAADVGRLEQDLSALGRETRGNRPEAGRQLEESARGLREDRVQDKIRFSKGLLRGGTPPEYARTLEESIAANIDSAAARIDRAERAMASSDSSGAGRALDRARELVQGLESLNERLRQQQGGPAGGQQQQGGQAGGRSGGQQQDGQAGGRSDGQPRDGQAGGRQSATQQEGGARPGQTAEQNNSASGRPAFVPPGQARQFQRELRERREAAEALRGEVERMELDPAELDRVIAELKRLETGRLFSDPSGLERLERDVLDRLKAFEFALRRRVEGDTNRPLVGPADQVPPKFKEMVEEYYRSLAKTGRRN
ncbi:MAG TPA: DUF4175 family protein, partial [Gemmatimonadales bacterium]